MSCAALAYDKDETMQKELIVLAAPVNDDAYYHDRASDILDFHREYVARISRSDDVLIFVDEPSYGRYVDAIGTDHTVVAPMLDIWMRDFSLSNAVNSIMFRYSAEGQGRGQQGQRDADAVQETLAALLKKAGLEFIETDLLIDGGNFVDDYAGNVVISNKFLRDNELSEEQGRSVFIELLGVKNIAFIDADEQGGLEHADGVVSFVDTNVLIINAYDEDPAYARQLRKDLQRGLPGVSIHEVVTPYDASEIHDPRFGSACGLYTNALVTPHRIYFPQFGITEDQLALEQVRNITTREVVPVPSASVCSMGGGVRCMSWQLRGDNAVKLLRYFGQEY